MKVQTTEAQAWWVALPDEIRPVRGFDGPMIFSGIQSTFNFPLPPSEIKGGGAEFLNGKMVDGDRHILITRLAVFTDGINVQVPTDTDDAEIVLQAALRFLFGVGVRRPTTQPLHFYQSTIIADFECALDSILPNALLKKISRAMPIEGDSHFFNIATNFDATKIADGRWRGINPTIFRIERRMSVPYDVHRYFCLANMKSTDHVEILKDFEKFAFKASK